MCTAPVFLFVIFGTKLAAKNGSALCLCVVLLDTIHCLLKNTLSCLFNKFTYFSGVKPSSFFQYKPMCCWYLHHSLPMESICVKILKIWTCLVRIWEIYSILTVGLGMAVHYLVILPKIPFSTINTILHL